MTENVSNHCHIIYNGIFRLLDWEPAYDELVTFAEKHGLSKDEFSEELCQMIQSESILNYPKGKEFRESLLNFLSFVGTTNCVDYMYHVLENESIRYKACAALSLLHVTDYSTNSLYKIIPYVNDRHVGLWVFNDLSSLLMYGDKESPIRTRILEFFCSVTRTNCFNYSYLDRILCRECPDYPNSDLRKEMFARLNLPIPGTEQVASEPSPSHPDSHHGWLKRSLLVGIPILFVGGVLYWKRKQRFSKSYCHGNR